MHVLKLPQSCCQILSILDEVATCMVSTVITLNRDVQLTVMSVCVHNNYVLGYHENKSDVERLKTSGLLHYGVTIATCTRPTCWWTDAV